MPVDFDTLIADEKITINNLERELQKHRQLLEALTLQSINHQATDTPKETVALTTENDPAFNSAVSEKESVLTVDPNKEPHHINKESEALLRIIKNETLPANIISARCKLAGFNLDRTAVNSRLGVYKRTYGMVETPSRGMYRLSEKGRLYMDKYYPDPKF